MQSWSKCFRQDIGKLLIGLDQSNVKESELGDTLTDLEDVVTQMLLLLEAGRNLGPFLGRSVVLTQ